MATWSSPAFSQGYLLAQAWEQDAPLQQLSAVAAVAQALAESPGFAGDEPGGAEASSLPSSAPEVRPASEAHAERLVTNAQFYQWHAELELRVKCARPTGCAAPSLTPRLAQRRAHGQVPPLCKSAEGARGVVRARAG